MSLTRSSPPKSIPAPKGLDHLRIMERAAAYPNGAVATLHARYGEVFAFGFGPIRFVWLVGDEAGRLLAEHPERFRLRRAYHFLERIGGEGALITSDEPTHLRRRRLVQPAFHKGTLERALSVVRQRNRALFSSWEEGSTTDLYAGVRPTVLSTICELLLGPETLARTPTLVPDINTMMAFANLPFLAQSVRVPLPGTPWGRFVAARSRVDRVLFREIARRRQDSDSGGDDVISLLLAARDEDGAGLSEREIRDQAVSLVSAGFDTTSAALCWAVYGLLEHKDALTTFQEEIAQTGVDPEASALHRLPFLDRVFKETLRLYPPAPAVLREAAEGLEICGYSVPKGSLVAFSVYQTHRSVRYWEGPLSFRPERWEHAPRPYTYLPFGSGARYCIGAGLATLLVKATLVQIFSEVGLEPAWNAPIEDTGNTVHPKGGLPVRVRKR